MKNFTKQTQHAIVGCCDMTFIGTKNLAPHPVREASSLQPVDKSDVMIEVKGLCKNYSQSRQWNEFFGPKKRNSDAVTHVDLTISRGELFGLVGPNGAGKTTLIKMLTTLIAPTSGTIHIDGYDIRQESAVKKTIGLATSDERSFYWRLSGRRNLFFFASLHGMFGDTAKRNIERVLEQVQLHEVADRPFSSYSTGMKQRLAIARALVTEPKIVFLDEPTKGLDPTSTIRLHELIREDLVNDLGLTVFLTSHHLVEVEELCDRIAIMNHGQIRACGTMTELQSLIGSVEKYRIDAHKLSKAVALEIAVKDPEIKVNIKSDHHVTFEFDYNDADYRLEDVIREIFKKGGKILGISRDQIPLSTIFSHLTGENCVEVQEMPIISRSTGSEEKTQPAPSKNAAKTNSSNPIKTEDKNSPKTFVRRLNSFKHIVFALVKRDMLSETSYRLSFCMQIVETFLTICALFFLSRMLGQDTINHYLKPYGGDYFIFAIIGVGFFKYFNVGFSSFANKLRTEQMSGTLEAMLSSPAPLSLIVLGGSVWEFIMTTFRVGIFLVAGAFIGESSLSGGNYLLAVLILFLMVGSAASFGIISSCFIMVVKRGDPIGWLFRSSSFLLGGVLFPVTVLPDWMQNLALFIPTTHALKAMRMALLQGHSITQLLPEIGSLCVFCFGLLPLSLVVLRYSVRLAKKDGTLTHY